jgi:hypothetical protein
MFNVGKVLDVVPNTGEDTIPHIVKVNVRGQDSARWMPVVIGTHGDINIPKRDTRVLVGYMRGNKPFAIPMYAGDEDVREYEIGTRIIGHSETDSKFEIEPDGEIKLQHESGSTVKLKGNGDVIIDNAGKVLLGDDESANTEPVARRGDSVSVNPDTGDGSITEGSDTVESE